MRVHDSLHSNLRIVGTFIDYHKPVTVCMGFYTVPLPKISVCSLSHVQLWFNSMSYSKFCKSYLACVSPKYIGLVIGTNFN